MACGPCCENRSVFIGRQAAQKRKSVIGVVVGVIHVTALQPDRVHERGKCTVCAHLEHGIRAGNVEISIQTCRQASNTPTLGFSLQTGCEHRCLTVWRIARYLQTTRRQLLPAAHVVQIAIRQDRNRGTTVREDQRRLDAVR
jgi:hypothetical protein